MKQKSLINQLELGYAPLTAYEFATMKDDSLVEQALQKASLYVIGQRPVITFENVIPDDSEYQLNFEIHQKGNPNFVTVQPDGSVAKNPGGTGVSPVL